MLMPAPGSLTTTVTYNTDALSSQGSDRSGLVAGQQGHSLKKGSLSGGRANLGPVRPGVLRDLSWCSWVYFCVLAGLAVAAFVPARTTGTAYVAMLVLGLPMSAAAAVFSFVSSAVIFRDPGRNDFIIHMWLLLVWLVAALVQTVLVDQILHTVRLRNRRAP